MKKVIVLMALVVVMFCLSSVAVAEGWKEYEHKTYVGAYYAAVSYACLNTDYTNDSGVWASGKSTQYVRGCPQAILMAIMGRIAEIAKDAPRRDPEVSYIPLGR